MKGPRGPYFSAVCLFSAWRNGGLWINKLQTLKDVQLNRRLSLKWRYTKRLPKRRTYCISNFFLFNSLDRKRTDGLGVVKFPSVILQCSGWILCLIADGQSGIWITWIFLILNYCNIWVKCHADERNVMENNWHITFNLNV